MKVDLRDIPIVLHPVMMDITGMTLRAEWNATQIRAMRSAMPDVDIYLLYQGTSGASLVAATYMLLTKEERSCVKQIFCRKPGEKAHGPREVYQTEVPIKGDYIVIIVDDFISSGDTIENLISNFIDNTIKETEPLDWFMFLYGLWRLPEWQEPFYKKENITVMERILSNSIIK